MDKRYTKPEIADIWSSANKLRLWQVTELAVISARASLGRIPVEVFATIEKILQSTPIDMDKWEKKDKEIRHDLNAFVFERVENLPADLQQYFHEDITSYDTEEAAFATMLKLSIDIVQKAASGVCETLKKLALKYRFTIMNGDTHGQWAEIQTFGKRCLTWLAALRLSLENLEHAKKSVKFSKLAGAIGNYGGGLDPELEKETLRILGLEAFYGVTQIMPREFYAPIGQALAQVVATMDKIALDIRLGARSGNPIYQEPFGSLQTGSSIMPQKKNTISTEQMAGMNRMALGYSVMIHLNIVTWEERAIEQSSAERVAWPDLFHVTVHTLTTMEKVFSGLQVYPDNMMRQVVETRGTYACGPVKDFLRKRLASKLDTEAIYRIVQLAAFVAFKPDDHSKWLRANPRDSYDRSWNEFVRYENERMGQTCFVTINEIIKEGKLEVIPEIDVGLEKIVQWNIWLRELFADEEVQNDWKNLFHFHNLLKHEGFLFNEILAKAEVA